MTVAQMATSPGLEACMNAIMDCSYTAASTARILSRFDRHTLPVLLSMVDVCGRLARIGADTCEQQQRSPPLQSCGDVSRDCAMACSSLLGLIESQNPTVSNYRRAMVRVG
jgi:hypothetical protein